VVGGCIGWWWSALVGGGCERAEGKKNLGERGKRENENEKWWMAGTHICFFSFLYIYIFLIGWLTSKKPDDLRRECFSVALFLKQD
jgi:hypothetical protein